MASLSVLRTMLTATLGGILVAGTPASAAVVYEQRSETEPVAAWIADNDGANARLLAPNARSPKISPDGRTVVFLRSEAEVKGAKTSLMKVPASGGEATQLLPDTARNVLDGFDFSSDSRKVVLASGNQLRVVDVVTGKARRLARASGAFQPSFTGASIAPDGRRVVYSQRTRGERTAIFTVRVTGGKPKRIVAKGVANEAPVWGPKTIAFAHRATKAGVAEIYTVKPTGGGLRRMTTMGTLAKGQTGFAPVEWSADGSRLAGTFWSYGQAREDGISINAANGAFTRVDTTASWTNTYTSAHRISRDGTTVLATDYKTPGDVVTYPVGGGRPTVIARNADAPDWNR